MIEVREVSKRYGTQTVLDDVTLSVPAGGVTAVVGPNGAGKSTLLAIVGRLLEPDHGTVLVDGTGRTQGVLAPRATSSPSGSRSCARTTTCRSA